jgi:putative hydrolase
MGPPGWPLWQGLDFNDVMRMLNTPGPVNWELARRIAAETSTTDPETGQPAPAISIDDGERAKLIDLVRAAQTHIANATALDHALTLAVDVVDRRDWSRRTLDGLEPVIEALAVALTPPVDPDADPDPEPLPVSELEGTPFAALDPNMIASIVPALFPLLFGAYAGALAGLLAHFALGQYDLQLPLSSEPRLVFVASNIDAFAEDWSLPITDLRFALALREVVHGAQRSVPWVRDRLVRLSSEYVRGYELRPEALAEQFGGLADLDLSDPAAFEGFDLPGVDPAGLLDAMQTPAQQPVLEQLQRFAAVLEGYADTVVDAVGETLVPSLTQIEEALRRHRVDRGRAADFVDRMLGLELGREHYERGHAFCRGVIERAGLEGLDRLWASEAMLPTPNELEAPGLWLARIDLD